MVFTYDKDKANRFANSKDVQTFSINIHPVILAKTKDGVKNGKCAVRVSGNTSDKEKVFAEADRILDLLTEGNYTGSKNVKVK